MTTQIAISTESPKVFFSHDRLVTTTRDVADYFDKQHPHVTQKVESLDCSEQFLTSNFSLVHYQHNGNTYKMYELTKDGFMFLVMGFTGKRAARLKEAYIARFNQMEAELSREGRAPAPANPTMPVFPAGKEFIYVTRVSAGGVPVSMKVLRDDEFVASAAGHTQMLQMTGNVVISWQMLSKLTSEQVTRLWMDAKKQYLANSPF